MTFALSLEEKKTIANSVLEQYLSAMLCFEGRQTFINCSVVQ